MIFHVIYSAMCTLEPFIAASRKCLSTGRKSLADSQSLDLAVQVSAIDLGIKPALLYDSNSASADQVQLYLSYLQSAQLVSKTLLILDLNGNTLIVNPVSVRSNVEKMLYDSHVTVIDVCHQLEKPAIIDPTSSEVRRVIHDLLPFLKGLEQPSQAEKLHFFGEKSMEWNMCTVFGLLLGYPVTYWFDQTKSFENCLSMTPLVVTTASATLQGDYTGHRCCLYSFSVPGVVFKETQPILENWKLCLQKKFNQQSILKDLKVCQSTVTLPSVCL